MSEPVATPESAPSFGVGPRKGALLAAVIVVLAVLGWMLLTVVSQRAPLQDLWSWRVLLFASALVHIAVLLESEWLARPAHALPMRLVRVVGWSSLAALVAHAVVLLLLLVPALRSGVADGLAPPWAIAGAVVLVVLGAVLGLLVRWLSRRAAAGVPTTGPEGPAASVAADASAHPTAAPSPEHGPDTSPYVVACSGGGIRAAAFVLGGLNALQRLVPGHAWATDESPRLVAVSGGSYAAAALTMTRRFTVDATGAVQELDPPVPWRRAYALDSGELARLRRHTRDLFEPRTELALGFGSLLLGALFNVALALTALRAAAWLVAWATSRSGGLVLDGACPPTRSLCGVVDGFRGSDVWWQDETVLGWLLVTAGSFLVGVLLWITQGRINRVRGGTVPEGLVTWRRRFATWRVRTQYVSAGWLLALVLLPVLVAGLNGLALANSPTPAVAGVIRGLGFATQDQCVVAGGADVGRAVDEAALDARLSPGEKRSATGGACGVEVTVTLTVGEAGCPTAPGPGACTPDDAQWRAVGSDRVGAALTNGRVQGVAKILGGLATFLALLQTLRRSVTADDGRSGRGAALRRVVLMRVPILVVGLVALWLLAHWVFVFSTDVPPPGAASGSGARWVPSDAALGWPETVLPVLALLGALLVDANVTSMHDYYRARLHNAFAATHGEPPVGPVPAPGPKGSRAVTAEDRPAAPLSVGLPMAHFYRFSRLGGVPLTIATTANVQAYDSVPTRRGGTSLTVDEEVLGLHSTRPDAACRVPVAEYEEKVGFGYASIMSIVAMSGAAVSPLMGRFASTFGPFRVLLALFNIRVGVWVPNPRFSEEHRMEDWAGNWRKGAREWPRRPWFTGRPGAMQVVAEAFGQSSFDDQWLYLTDGGHLDNTGIVESVRVACRRTLGPGEWTKVLALDASNDKEGSWSAVGDALAIVRADLGVDLERVGGRPYAPEAPAADGVDEPARRFRPARTSASVASPDFARAYEDPVRRVSLLVVKAVRPVDLERADLPDSVRAFAMSTADFPRASTTRQDFSDLEFEAYRALGEWCTRRAVGG